MAVGLVVLVAVAVGWWAGQAFTDRSEPQAEPSAGVDELDDDGGSAIDAQAWQRVAHDEQTFGGDGQQEMWSVAAGGTGLVAVGVDEGRDAAAVWTSSDGRGWERVPHDEEILGGDGQQGMFSVAAGGPGLVAAGVDDGLGAMVWTSADGRSWQRVPRDEQVLGAGITFSVTAGGPGLVAVGVDEGPGRASAAVWTSPEPDLPETTVDLVGTPLRS